MDVDTADNYDRILDKIPYNEGRQLVEKKYIFGQELGKGAYGSVIGGYRRNDHCSVAIKVLPYDVITNWYFSKTLQMNIPMEVLLMALGARIDGVISILEYFHDPLESKWFIVMERFSTTIDLFEFICRKGFLSEIVACQIFYQLTVTIIDCHLRGILHRDIKEENILIDKGSKKVWLIDFGSGSIMNDDIHFSYDGTLAYAPPEWLKYGQYRGCQLESWSLGIVLYSMVCGSIPFDDEEQILSSYIRFPRNISKDCKDLIMKCLERDPKLRIHPIEIITHPWIASTLKSCDSGHGSFDNAYLENACGNRRCSCSCADKASLYCKEESIDVKATIESVDYDSECIKEIDREFSRRFSSKSLSPRLSRGRDFFSPPCSIMDKRDSIFKSLSVMEMNYKNSGLLMDKLTKILADQDCGYEEDIDDDFQLYDECIEPVMFAVEL